MRWPTLTPLLWSQLEVEIARCVESQVSWGGPQSRAGFLGCLPCSFLPNIKSSTFSLMAGETWLRLTLLLLGLRFFLVTHCSGNLGTNSCRAIIIIMSINLHSLRQPRHEVMNVAVLVKFAWFDFLMKNYFVSSLIKSYLFLFGSSSLTSLTSWYSWKTILDARHDSDMK